MKVIYGLGAFKKNISLKPAVVGVGVFDGVHRGHQKILRALRRLSRAHGGQSVVITFAFHPSRLVSPTEKILHLTTLEEKLSLFEKEGIDRCHVIYFDRTFASLEAQRFVEEFLMKRLNMKALCVGEDFVFGRGARGNVALLRKLSLKFHFKLMVVKHLKAGGRVVSSTLIRHLVRQGQLEKAGILLGHDLTLTGRVMPGVRRGRALGFPTANLKLPGDSVFTDGIYAARVALKNKIYQSVVYIGRRPTFYKKAKCRVAEVYLFGFLKSIYGCTLQVRFVKKLRDDRAFPTPQALQQQIEKDVRLARIVLKNPSV